MPLKVVLMKVMQGQEGESQEEKPAKLSQVYHANWLENQRREVQVGVSNYA